jgi:hypothetical protein
MGIVFERLRQPDGGFTANAHRHAGGSAISRAAIGHATLADAHRHFTIGHGDPHAHGCAIQHTHRYAHDNAIARGHLWAIASHTVDVDAAQIEPILRLGAVFT